MYMTRLVQRLSSQEMESGSRIQTLGEAVCVPLHVKDRKKGMNPFNLPLPAM